MSHSVTLALTNQPPEIALVAVVESRLHNHKHTGLVLRAALSLVALCLLNLSLVLSHTRSLLAALLPACDVCVLRNYTQVASDASECSVQTE
uniref:Uncharacterized protein n=1 Tax=Anopheles christyi TaxID=43041 RepID=A0A182KIS2_9DIPT